MIRPPPDPGTRLSARAPLPRTQLPVVASGYVTPGYGAGRWPADRPASPDGTDARSQAIGSARPAVAAA